MSWGFLPCTTGRIVAIFTEMRNSGEGRVRWKKRDFFSSRDSFGHVGLECLLHTRVKVPTHRVWSEGRSQ